MKVAPRLLFALSSFPLAGAALADVRLPAILSDHLVLQGGKPAVIWGWADPAEKVRVDLGGSKAETSAGTDGKWRLSVALPAGQGPHQLSVEGRNRLTVSDVMVGELWVCSGQSNMEWTVAKAEKPEEEAAAAQFPKIRHFKVQRAISASPLDDVKGAWVVCTPETVLEFSAVGYFFGRELHRQLGGVPVGLLGSNWGGTPVESWMSRKTLEADPAFKPMLDRFETSAKGFDPQKAKESHERALAAWTSAAAKAKEEGKPAPRKPVLAQRVSDGPNYPCNLYNGMIAPLLNLQIRGAIWYQGESNVSRASLYRSLFPAMIGNWRSDFAQGEFPFYFVQLAPFGYNRANPDADRTPCAELWDAQLHTLRTVPNTGMAVTTDIGNIQDIHPKNKQDVGLRLALWALTQEYGKKGVEFSGPLYKEAKVESGKIRVRFDHGSGLKARDGNALTHFTIAGEDQKFVEAQAVVDGETLLIQSSEVPKPVAVRFAWREDAEPNLINAAGLPASPFRTDSFPAVTADKF
jgi:sialate O-acetylesterase